MNYSDLQNKVSVFVHEYFAGNTDGRLVYHNQHHTERVVAAATQIANHYQLDERNFFIVQAAAWFHDIGYFTNIAAHEEQSALLAEAFLKEQGVPEDLVTEIKDCIAATRMPQSARKLNEQILCDADLFHLGTDEFSTLHKLLRKEIEALKGRSISKDDWRKGNIQMLTMHHYYTDYCRLLLDDKKQKNLEKLKRKAEAPEPEPATSVSAPAAAVAAIAEEPVQKEGKKKDKDKPERGIETMFRITSNNNQRLSDMADNKAHIMITVNSIILSAIISLLLGKINNKQDYLAIPTYMILAVSVSTIIFSILATRPSLPKGTYTEQDLSEKKVNLLFFGNFYKMSLDAYADGMRQVMADRDFLYGSLIKDVYSQGIVLGRKYRLLRISYNIFMFGLIIAVLAFVTASIAHVS
ncbi:Pycsar system effector family protein [Taibaiella chishuiensis]|uniref:Putative metal-dependent HD superfamily phosphohydrolase n=1 Tax=Taibaiella chishuiensis TaxID=1434707 RepID=A0A2P8D752_9BACT|nr:Pycsar system effector family protein [Taibaiella chishuiensis]PSK93055.1 putative metal-dependent HD superfamily phosphohydrolase [Taibaiella chishuiensis]